MAYGALPPPTPIERGRITGCTGPPKARRRVPARNRERTIPIEGVHRKPRLTALNAEVAAQRQGSSGDPCDDCAWRGPSSLRAPLLPTTKRRLTNRGREAHAGIGTRHFSPSPSDYTPAPPWIIKGGGRAPFRVIAYTNTHPRTSNTPCRWFRSTVKIQDYVRAGIVDVG